MSQHISKKSSFHRNKPFTTINKDDINVIIKQEFSQPILIEPKSFSFLMNNHLKRPSSSSNPISPVSNSSPCHVLISRHHSTSGSFVRRNQLRYKTSLISVAHNMV